MSKRQPERSISKDQKASKKIKTNVPDIPSSNFVSREPTKTHRYGSITESEIKSVPKIGLNVKNSLQVTSNRSLPKVYQDAMGPDVHQLMKYKKEKMESEKTQKGSNKARSARNEKQELKEAKEEEKVPLETLRNQISKLRDEEDKLVFEKKVNSLKININREREKKIKQMLNPPRGNSRNSKFFDPTLSLKSQTRKERRKSHAFQFIEKGSIIKKGEIVSRDLQGNSENDIMNKLQQQIDQSSLIQIEMTKTQISSKRYDPVPNVEWWDAHLLPTTKSYLQEDDAIVQEEKGKENNDCGNNDIEEASLVERLNKRLELFKENIAFDSSFLQSQINNIIVHPVAFKGDISNQNPVMPVYLTKDERKKLRRMRRLAKQKEMQEKISLGLVEPPPPKLKYTNFMRIMQYQAIMDPTSAEMQVRKAVQDRLQGHLDRNAKRKLTKKQKAEKCMQKLKRDAAVECRVAVFRVDDLSYGAHKFKVNMNAQQLALNGACIVAKSGLNLPSVVVVEGGPKAIKFYKKLMLRRIKWNMKSNKGVMESGEASGEDAMNAQEEYGNKCSLAWEGIARDRSFSKWMTIDIRSEIEGRRLFADRGVEFYWDRVMTGMGDKDDEE